MTSSSLRRHGPGHSAGRAQGFTLIELLVVISIIALLIAIMLHVLGRAREASRNTVCLSNQRQIGLSFGAYHVDFSQTYPHYFNPAPRRELWTGIMHYYDYMPVWKGFTCPSFQSWQEPHRLISEQKRPVSDLNYSYSDYGYNRENVGSSRRINNSILPPARADQILNPSFTILTVDSIASTLSPTGQPMGAYTVLDFAKPDEYQAHARHMGESNVNVLWCDGRASSQKVDDPARPYDDNALTSVSSPLSIRLWDRE